MIGFGRTDRHFLANWWWTIDRWLLLGIASLMVVGFVMTFAASPVIAHRLEIDTYHFCLSPDCFSRYGSCGDDNRLLPCWSLCKFVGLLWGWVFLR